MPLIPSRQDIAQLLDDLDRSKVADDLESEVLEFKPWLADVKDNQAVAIELAACFANNSECRELLGLGSSPSAIVKASNLLRSLDFLMPIGKSRQKMRYALRKSFNS